MTEEVALCGGYTHGTVAANAVNILLLSQFIMIKMKKLSVGKKNIFLMN